MAFLKAPGGPFSFSHQLLSTHSANFLKAQSPGAEQVGVLLLLQAWSQEPRLMVASAPDQAESPCCLPPHVKSKGRIRRLWANQRTLPLIICILDPFQLPSEQMGRFYLPSWNCAHTGQDSAFIKHYDLLKRMTESFILKGGQWRKSVARKLDDKHSFVTKPP